MIHIALFFFFYRNYRSVDLRPSHTHASHTHPRFYKSFFSRKMHQLGMICTAEHTKQLKMWFKRTT